MAKGGKRTKKDGDGQASQAKADKAGVKAQAKLERRLEKAEAAEARRRRQLEKASREVADLRQQVVRPATPEVIAEPRVELGSLADEAVTQQPAEGEPSEPGRGRSVHGAGHPPHAPGPILGADGAPAIALPSADDPQPPAG